MTLTTIPSLLGQANLSGSDLALFLKKFSGMVMTTFAEKNVMEPLVMHATIDSGKTFQFPVIGQAQAVHHVRAESIYDQTKNYLNTIEHGERTINVDRPLVSPVFVDNWDQLLNHYDTQAIYSSELGAALAVKKDQLLLRVLVKAARTGATLSATRPDLSGLAIDSATMATSASALRAGILEAAQTLVEKDIPMNELCVMVRPAQYYPLMDEGWFINADYNPAGNGSRSMAVVDKAYGFRVMMTNHLPDSIVTTEVGQLNDYAGDFTKTVAVCFHKSAIGAVRRTGVAIESEYSVERQGSLLLAKMIEGYGILRPECAVELAVT